MKNFLKEIEDLLVRFNISQDKVMWVTNELFWCSWEEFKTIADFDYDDTLIEFENDHIDSNVSINGSDFRININPSTIYNNWQILYPIPKHEETKPKTHMICRHMFTSLKHKKRIAESEDLGRSPEYSHYDHTIFFTDDLIKYSHDNKTILCLDYCIELYKLSIGK